MTVVYLWSFPNTGQTGTELRRSREMLAPMLTDAVANGDALICRGGLGFVFWLRLNERLWFVPYIAVVPRGKGYGTQLLRDLLTEADSQRCGVALQCVPSLVPWYGRHGFAPASNPLVIGPDPNPSSGLIRLSRRPQSLVGR